MSWIHEIVHHLRGGAHAESAGCVLAIMSSDKDADVLLDIASGAEWVLEIRSKYDGIREGPPVILYDRDLQDSTTWQNRIRSLANEYPRSAVILVSRDNDDHLWQEVTQLGGFDVLTKPLERTRVLRSIEFALAGQDRTTR